MTTSTIVKVVREDTVQRVIETIYSIEDTRFEDKHDGSTVAQLVVTTSHYKERRGFLTSVRRQLAASRFTRTAIDFGKSDPIQARITPVARYSAKALQERHAAFEADVEPYLTECIEWARGAVAQLAD